jgi:urea transport system permease protein
MDPLNPSAGAPASPGHAAARAGLRPALRRWLTTDGYGSIVVLAVLILVVFPLALDVFRLNLMGKYLTYAFVAVGLVMAWGYGGVLSLGQGVFFGLGGYCMAMFLKLEASDPVSTKIQSTPGIPDFMDWNIRCRSRLRRWWSCRARWRSWWASPCSSGAWAACTSPSSRRRWR